MSMTPLMPIVAASLTPDASRAATVAKGGVLRTWVNGVVVPTGKSSVDIGGGPTAAALFDNVVKVLWVAGGMLRLYEYGPGTRERYYTLPAPARVRALALSPSGSAAVVACKDGTLRGLDVRTRKFGRMLTTGALPVRAVAMASDDGPIAAAFADGAVRRYDLGDGTSDIVGVGTPASAVAVTPDGKVVVTAADGVLCRWDLRTGAPPKIRTLDTVITAVAVDGTGDKVLVGADNGRLWLHDLAGGPGVEYIVPAGAPLRVPAHDAPQPPRSQPPPRSQVDDDVRFTVYRPQVLSPGLWASLLVFAHKTNVVEEPGRAPVDPQEQVEARARAHFGGAPPRPVGEDARQQIIRGEQLRIVPDLPGIRCNPRDAEVEWWEPVHEVLFRLLAGPELAGTVVRGAVRVWCGPLILGEVFMAISVAADGAAAGAMPVAQSVRRYRKIFPSYSHRDRAIVANFAEKARALGDQYLQDVLTLRSGERWNARLLELIEDADVFQLFWSHNSMRSPHCREEWEHALALQRPLFVRPLYWEEPLPEDRGQELPPATLLALQFVKVPVVEPKPGGGRKRAPRGGTRRGRTRWPEAAGGAAAAAAAVVVGVIIYAGLHVGGPASVMSPSPSMSTTLASIPASTPAPGVTATAQFTNLHNGSRVSFTQQVTGLVSGIPAGMDIWLVVQPLLAPQYWPQSGPLLIVGGQFHTVAYFGPSSAFSRGEEFNLIIVSAPQDASQRFREFLQEPQAAGLSALPDGAQPLTQILVKRS